MTIKPRNKIDSNTVLQNGMAMKTSLWSEKQEFHTSGIAPALGSLGSGALVSEKGLATLLGCNPVTIRRALRRGELPPPVKMFGKPTWTVGAMVRHIEERLERAAEEARILSEKRLI